MKPLRFMILVLILGAVAVSGAGAQNPDGEPVKITVERETLKPGEKTTVYIELDFRTRLPIRESESAVVRAIFSVRASRGTITHSKITYGQWVPSNGWYIIAPNLERFTRARSHIEVIFEAPAQAGEVQISVEGQHGGAAGGLAPWKYQGLKNINVLQTSPTDTPTGPARRPPFSPTPGSVNPTNVMISLAAGLAILLAAAASVKYGVRMLRRKKEGLEKPVKKEPPAPPPPAVPPKVSLDTSQVHWTDPQKKRFDPETAVRVILEADPYAPDGDGTKEIILTATAIPAEGGWARILSAQFSANRRGYEPKGMPQEPAMMVDFRKAKVRVPWEWSDQVVGFSVVVQVEGSVTLTQAQGVERSVVGFPPITKQARCEARVNGANPQVFVESDKMEVSATGWNAVALSAELWLFGKRAPATEVMKIAEVASWPNAEWNHLAPEKSQNGNPARATWIPPFLIQEPGYVEEVVLTITCEWTGGTLWQRAVASPEGMQRIPPDKIVILVSGCTATVRPETNSFSPIASTVLLASGKLTDSEGKGVNPFKKGAVCSPKAGVHCEVCDRSQGSWTELNDCKLPPEPTTIRQRVITPSPVVAVDDSGELFTPGEPPEQGTGRRYIRLWKYEPLKDKNIEPIHYGPVEYTLVIEDGYKGSITLKGASHVSLGDLILETGGPDFRIYEHRPYRMEVEYKPWRYYEEETALRRLVWSFAVVDEEGLPIRDAGSIERWVRIDSKQPKAGLIIGHTPDEYDIAIQPSTQEVKYALRSSAAASGTGGQAGEWHSIDDDDRKGAAKLRGKWHDLRKELGKPDIGIPGLSPRPGSPWRNMTLAMAVRVELFDAEGHLLATSDRVMDTVRTPPKYVWRDHRFKFVFRLPVLFVPGIIESQLNDGDHCLWPPGRQKTLDLELRPGAMLHTDSPIVQPPQKVQLRNPTWRDLLHDYLHEHPKLLELPASGKPEKLLQPVDVIYDTVYGEVDRGLIKGFMAELGYWEADPSVPDKTGNQPIGTGDRLGFWLMPYDWRLDNRTHAKTLAEKIAGLITSYYPEEVRPEHRKMLLLVHSMGGLISWHFGNSSQYRKVWDDHVAAYVMLATPIMGAVESVLTALSGRFPMPASFGDRIRENLLVDWLNEAWPESSRGLLLNHPSVYQLMAPYHPCVHIDSQESMAVRPIEVEVKLKERVKEIVATQIQQGNLVVNCIPTVAGDQSWVRYTAPREQLIGIDQDGNVSLWFNRKLLEEGVMFHDEKKKNPPPRSLLIYGDGRRIVDGVIVKIVVNSLDMAPQPPFPGFVNGFNWSDFASALDEAIWRIFHQEFPFLPRRRFAQHHHGRYVELMDIQINPKPPKPGVGWLWEEIERFVKHLQGAGIPAEYEGKAIHLETEPGEVTVRFPIRDRVLLTFDVGYVLKERGGDGTVPNWSVLTEGLPQVLPMYRVDLKNDVPITGNVVHRAIASDPEVQELLRSILTGMMPNPDQGPRWWEVDVQ